MLRAQSSSSCSHNSWLMRNQSLFCTSGGCRGLGEAPTCNCGVETVLRMARTIKNGGRQFWRTAEASSSQLRPLQRTEGNLCPSSPITERKSTTEP